MMAVQTLDRKNIGLRVLNLGMDTHTRTGKADADGPGWGRAVRTENDA